MRNKNYLKQEQLGTEAPAYLCITGSLLVFWTTPDTWYSKQSYGHWASNKCRRLFSGGTL